MNVDLFGTHDRPTADRIEIINAFNRTVIAQLLVFGILYALYKEFLDGNTFLQVASMAVMYYLARTTSAPTLSAPATSVTTTLPATNGGPGGTTTVTTGTPTTPAPHTTP